ncbi:lipoprotein [uncultured Cohaesibacter sp.]|uniref:LPS translocon maturation chaperone LptM n=1 Tax=uncultured Cohaesibacter sp. TaxID=1002546 RepID=UPI002930B739|nr:lipoprotein [uncultured Cohaesibacter sp.]
MAKYTVSKPCTKTVATLLIALAATAGLSACGVRGPLKPPSSVVNSQSKQTDPAAKQETLGEQQPETTPAKAPEKGFFLDPLL